ncbi:TIGR03943 family protein [Clostridium sp. E02]|uniref:TIGR03943 family putative permease subunit n=1 Tax=Clostridium sp. E02 TaxID=2487134 RepID=UPI000F549DEF|nr:TIGR03943 family protein [Clostridium sp. E02]
MKITGKGLNLQAIVETMSDLVFGILLFRLTKSGAYLSYVTPRMKPYLYGLSILMFLWAMSNGTNIFKPKYKGKYGHFLVLFIPILILLSPPVKKTSGSMIKNYTNDNIPGALAESSDSSAYDAYGYGDDLEKPDLGETQKEDGWEESQSEDSSLPPDTKTELQGLDEEKKTITIADEDYYNWMVELGSNPKKYLDYKIIMKGFVFLDIDERKAQEFALVRLSMWCCSADMSPIGLLVQYDGELNFKEDDWITVTGKLQMDGSYPGILAEQVEAAEKPEEEYVYPYY